MEEMRLLIERGRGAPIRSESPTRETSRTDESTNIEHLKDLVQSAEQDLNRAINNHELLQSDLQLVASTYNEVY